MTLSQPEATLTIGETLPLTATVFPENATDKSVTWTTSNASVATVSTEGVVTAVAAGTATITVTTTDGSFTDTCTITVIDPDKEAANAVIALFNALPADITLEDKAAIEAARAAYEALTADQKALVSDEDLAKLTKAEEALAAIEKVTGVENVQGDVKNVKIIENGQIYILRGDKTYTVTGQEIR